ncbi:MULTISPECIES: hypothetical protein [Citrobacter]|uniref:hypothetical protein n=1 Tax=Citrobacter TaxID=544 RepID=UPI00027286C9|nr:MULTISPECIES: hypothetical protein [Citrobacter]EJF22590.1 putative phage protein [Citrobacter sp. A1]EJO6493242.1 hypothetical protein [Citrobacter freundii]EKT8687131.1 hypothetical protein [Citrobacter freundii]EKU35493.1 dna repair atpase [Citrobacter sp. L17]EKU7595308.1 hypothetical protein [Citrobacter freundii]
MTTNNHPAHGPVSLDRLHQIREILSKAAAQSDGGNLGYAMADAVKVIDGAIAARNVENIYQVMYGECWRDITEEQYHDHAIHESPIRIVYTAPPVPVVPNDLLSMAASAIEDLLEHTDPSTSYYSGVWADVPGKLRAAMLQAGNPPVIQDGWQLVPKDPTEAMNKAGWAAMNEHDAINPTYRAMLAAAPQQDVRLALEIGMSRYAGAMQKLVDSGD